MTSSYQSLGAEDYPAWNAFVAASPQGSVFASTPYLEALGCRFQLLAVRRGKEILAGVPLIQGHLGAYALPLFVKYAGVLFAALPGTETTQASRRYELHEHLLPGLRRYPSFEYNFHPGYDNWLPLRWAGYRQTTLYTYRLPAERAGTWLEESHSRVRRHVRAAERRQLHCVVRADYDDLIYDLLMAPYRQRQAPPPKGRAAMTRFATALIAGGLGRVWQAVSGHGDPQCAALVIEDQQWAYLLAHGCKPETDPAANTYLIAEIIDDTLGRGLGFDFEGSVIRPIEHYYRGFGGDLVPYSRIWRPGLASNARRLGLAAARRVLGYER
ncbi:hypothetical protein [uncultured Thiohalocapsa sp.]|uniref:hypothetical protein n=1 Tax=uncultured Thiohalocapsa sp. TaxID=768990 RepID=UPI0025EF9E0A|nr:hypothetical protein [uncultured Thiohalocapsa sp.]